MIAGLAIAVRPLHRLRRSLSPVNGGGSAVAPPAILPRAAGEGDHAQHGGEGAA